MFQVLLTRTLRNLEELHADTLAEFQHHLSNFEDGDFISLSRRAYRLAALKTKIDMLSTDPPPTYRDLMESLTREEKGCRDEAVSLLTSGQLMYPPSSDARKLYGAEKMRNDTIRELGARSWVISRVFTHVLEQARCLKKADEDELDFGEDEIWPRETEARPN